ncbi:MAG TPA: PAS domain S-box protein, partial [Rhodothermales bacterium]|nr:PAS domain S-box protein [Rhodothermales bacterium]
MASSSSRSAPPPETPKIVGIGASAGGLRALKDFFGALPADTGMAFVVVVHRSSEAESGLPGLIGSYTGMPMVEVTTRVAVAPDHVYLIPTGQQLVAEDGHLDVQPFDQPEDKRFALDVFFRTHAEAHGDGVAVVLSGAGTDGSVGIKHVKEAGGLVFVQEPTEAAHAGMPRAAIETGAVDFVLPVADIARQVAGLAGGPPVPEEPKALPGTEAEALHKILAQLRVRTSHDFTSYKPATVLRRVGRRMQAHGIETLAAYLELLCTSAEEAHALFQDLLISVTSFFRDRAAFEALEKQVIPRLFEGKRAGEKIRVWSVGCATGEEAYSLAMLLLEAAEQQQEDIGFQVFASDLSEEALEVAREGLYPDAIAADVEEERLRRFFVKEDSHYRVRGEVRKNVLFAPHSLLRDPPFSKLDLIVCRNLLIYLNRDLQERVFELFHYALRPGGYLFLGTAENAEVARDLFRTVQKKHRLYVRRDAPANPPRLPSLPLLRVDALTRRAGEPRHAAAAGPGALVPAEVHARLLEAAAPPSVVVDELHDIVHLSGGAGRFLVHPGGPPTNNIVRLVREELRLDLRSALQEAFDQGRTVASRLIPVRFNGHAVGVHFLVRPEVEPRAGRTLALVLFSEVELPAGIVAGTVAPEEHVRQLEEEVTRLHERLRMTVEEYETSTEELKAANEELQSINEEYKGTLEELETSKEELQSVNEELQTVNYELKSKVDELTGANADLQNLMASTEIATLFLDRHLRIRRFTPSLEALFNVIAADRGRSITHVTHHLHYPGLLEDMQRVVKTLQPVSREVQSEQGRWYVTTIRPYRTVEDRIDGVVLTFVDVSERLAAEAALRESEARYRQLLESAKDFAIFTLDSERRVTTWNTGAERLMGYTEAEIIGQSGDVIFTEEDRDKEAPEREAATAAAKGKAANERWHVRKDGSRFWGSGMTTPIREGDTLRGFVKIMRDETVRHEAEEALRESLERYRAVSESGLLAIAYFDTEGTITDANCAFLDLVGYTRAELDAGEVRWDRLTPPEWSSRTRQALEEFRRTGRITSYEKEYFRRDGSRFWGLSGGERLESGEGVAFVLDITEQKQAEAAHVAQAEQQQAIFENVREYAILMLDADRKITAWNAGAELIFGYDQAEALGMSGEVIFTDEDRAREAPEREAETAATHGQAADERWHVRKDGSRFWGSGIMTALKHADGSVRGFVKILRDETERRQAERDLQESEARLRLALDATQMGTWRYDLVAQQARLDARMREILGLAPDAEVVPLALVYETIHPDDRERVSRAIRDATEKTGDGRYSLEYRVVHPDRTLRHVASYGRVFFEDDRPVDVFGTTMDVTGLREAEAALRESRERFGSVSESGLLAIAAFDAAGTITDANQAFLDLVGFTRREVEAGVVGWDTLAAPDWGPRVRETLAEFTERGRIRPHEMEYQRRDGARFWALFGADRIEATGEGIGFLVDITRRKEAEAALRESEIRLRRSEEQLRLAVQSARMGLWMWDVQEDVFTRLHFHRTLLKPGDEQPQPFSGFLARIHFDDRDRVEKAFQAALRGQRRLNVEYRTSGPNGETCWMACVGEVVRDEDGAPVHVYGIVHDVTS